ncbi:MAG: tetratricopeptide repeat protein [Candidatus Omnitrophica bacterium]|nr:tetratricopeptide repeat protein [Candidatus Omnitrophota bacterium]
MPQIDLESERKRLDREITFFHFKRAHMIRARALKTAQKKKDKFFILYFTSQKYILTGKFQTALYFLDKALRIHPHDGCSYNDKALCWAEQGEYRRALQYFDEGIRHDPDCATLYHNKGWLLNLLGRHRAAILCFKKTLELEPGRPESLYSLADSYEQLGDEKFSQRYFRSALHAVSGKCRYMVRHIRRRIGQEE